MTSLCPSVWLKLNGWRILSGESSLASFLACIDECISERECRMFEKGFGISYVQKVREEVNKNLALCK